ncbi:MAG: gliding motility lipoprotein GldD [Bacteroidales bacterium]|nr:gliding motility lipoprotein GldD [Bacteroidales bacterium]
MRINKLILFMAAMVLACFIVSCNNGETYLPKPRGYFRIDLPEKAYTRVDTIERYSFECPQYALVTPDPYSPNEKNWVNIEMPQFKGSIHITHKPVNGNLSEYLEDVHTMVTKHLQKANGVSDSLIVNDEHHVYGLFIEMDGKGVATPMQFYLTDSTRNFVRGALYFNFKPDNDSMRPVINFIREDIDHMINSFEWK